MGGPLSRPTKRRPKRHINLRVDEDIMEFVDEFCKENDMTRSEVVQHALRLWVNDG